MSIEAELMEIKGGAEFLTAERVVSWAKANPKSELYNHPGFMGWDAKKLAYEHCLWVARRLIAIHIRYEDGERRIVSLSLDRKREGGGYRMVDDVLADRTLHEIMLEDALRELGRMQERYEKLRELKPLWREAAKVRARQRGRRSGKERRVSA